MASKIHDIKDIREMLKGGDAFNSTLTLAKRIADFYGEQYGIYNPPLEDWEKELLTVNKPNWKLEFPWLVGYTSGSGHYTMGRFPTLEAAKVFQTALLENLSDRYDGAFVNYDIEEV